MGDTDEEEEGGEKGDKDKETEQDPEAEDKPEQGDQIPIVAAKGSETWSDDPEKWGVQNSLDEDPASIFHSKSDKNGWAKYFIPTSNVKTVKVLNRKDCCG